MPKARFTLSDVAAMAREVSQKCGDWRVNQVYDGDGRTFILKLQQSGEAEKRLLLLESGTKFLVTRFDAREAPGEMPSPLCSKLRTALKGKRLTSVKALGRDRVVALRFGAGPGTYNVFLELYAAGNVVLADSSYKVVAALRSAIGFSEVGLKVGESYPVALRQLAPPSSMLSAEELQQFLEDCLQKRVARVQAAQLESTGAPTKKKKRRRGIWTLAQLLLDRGSGVDAYGSDVVGHCVAAAGLDGSTTLEKQPEGWALRLHAALSEAPALALSVENGTLSKPRILLEEGVFASFAPCAFRQHAAHEVREFPSFCAAVDEYFRETKETKLASRAHDATSAITAKVDKIRNDQEKRVEDLEAGCLAKERAAQLLEEKADQVDAVIQVLNNALSSGLRWDEVRDYVEEEQAKGSPLASLVTDLDFDKRLVTFALGDDSAKVSLDETARACSTTLWTLAKTARQKVLKTQQASVKVVKQAEKQADARLKARAWKQDAGKLKRQKGIPAWFQRFAWFVSSEGYLVVAPRDRGQAEQVLYGGVLRATDALVLCDATDAPPTVVRAKDGRLSPLALHEAGCFAACRSKAWENKDRAPAYWVPGSCVRRVGAPRSSQVLDVLGDMALVTSTKKTYLPPTQLKLTFALLFKLGDGCDACDRPTRVPSSELITLDVADDVVEAVAEVAISTGPQLHEEAEAPVAIADAAPLPVESHFARSGKLTARERKLLKKFGGDVEAMRNAEQQRLGARTREGRRAPSPEPIEVEEAVAAPVPVEKLPKKKMRGQKKKKKGCTPDSSDDDGPRVPLRLQKVPTVSKRKKKVVVEVDDDDEQAPEVVEPPPPPAVPSTAELLDGTSDQALARLGPCAQDAWARCRSHIPELDGAAMAYELHRVADLNDDEKATGVFANFLDADASEQTRCEQRREAADARAKRTGLPSDFVDAPRNLPALLSGICRRVARGASGDGWRGGHSKATTTGVSIEGCDADHVGRLTGTPRAGDVLMEAIAVCCPTSACRGFAHALKFQPGGTKKGRAARDALEILARSADDEAHRDLIRDVDANDAILAMVGATRITHTAAAQLNKDRAVDIKQHKKLRRKEASS